MLAMRRLIITPREIALRDMMRLMRGAGIAIGASMIGGACFAQAPAAGSTLLGVNCDAAPALHCPDTACDSNLVTQPGNTVELKTRRTFFLDCPKGYKPGDKVNVVLSL